MNELEAKMENVLATIDKVFKVELMKMPPSLQNSRIGDLISGGFLTIPHCSPICSDSSPSLFLKRRKCPVRCPSP